jgi:hypothetical protein
VGGLQRRSDTIETVIGSSARSPIGKAVVGVVGETSTSTSAKARSKSREMSVRTFWAEP